MRLLRILLSLAVLLGAAYLVLGLLAEPRSEYAYERLLPAGVAVLAHAGGALLWPDNTMTAFSAANELGADVLELDVHESASGEFVVIHDATVDRTTDGHGAIADLTLQELRRLDAGYRWTPTGPRQDAEGTEFSYRGAGVTLPTLAEVLAAFPTTAVNVELKQDSGDAAVSLCETVRAAGAVDRVMVGSFHGGPLATFREACPEVSTSASQNEVIVFLALEKLRLSAVLTPPYDALQVPVERSGIRIVTPHFVKAAHARGVDVHVWTINDAAEMQELVAMDVDGLISDRPDRALQVLGREYDAALVPAFVEP